jgi:hypothetical protein
LSARVDPSIIVTLERAVIAVDLETSKAVPAVDRILAIHTIYGPKGVADQRLYETGTLMQSDRFIGHVAEGLVKALGSWAEADETDVFMEENAGRVFVIVAHDLPA